MPLLLVLLLAGCAPTVAQYEAPGIERLSALELHQASLTFMRRSGYQITVSDPTSGFIAGSYYGMYSRTQYLGSVSIYAHHGNAMEWNFAFPGHNHAFGQYLQDYVARASRR